jgi:hypothetical protein
VRSLVIVAALHAIAVASPCPPAETLAPLAHETWPSLPAAPTCTAIHARRPLVLVVDAADFDGHATTARSPALVGYAAIVDAGTITWHATFHHMTPGTWQDWTVADLDGDGIDELIEVEHHTGHMGFGSRRLIVHAIVDGMPTGDAALDLDQYGLEKGAEQNGCHATYRIVRDHRRSVIEVVGTRGGDPKLSPTPVSCPLAGKHRYEWDGSRLVETP